LNAVDDVEILKSAVATISGTYDHQWVPVWRELGATFERQGDDLAATGELTRARSAYLQAKTYYSIGRFPSALTPLKAEVSADCDRAFLKASSFLDPPLQVVEIPCEGRSIVAHYRSPIMASSHSPVPAVLVMCGADVFKEDRGWAGELAMNNGLASVVMDAPGTGQNPFPYEPEWVKAWMAAVDWLASRPEVDPRRVGAFGISRGGYSVLQLAGSYPERVRAAVAIAGNHFGYRPGPEEAAALVEIANQRSTYVFGAPGDPPSFAPTTIEREETLHKKWALSELGLVDRIVCPTLMINGKRDHLAPIGNIYYMLEHGPVTGREARVYPDAGHCAFEHRDEWGPASFEWLAAKL
jgi:pimeloyl-ACP methyl ester carboxylesterase